jgi:hypothetical protein
MGHDIFGGQMVHAVHQGFDVPVGVSILNTDGQNKVQGWVAQIRCHYSTSALCISTTLILNSTLTPQK